ncbi:hypothetical protein ACH492_22430 [Streptomyces sp. NPDC019443]|uniref:hypothetical protein n=1 Tax=Streptomyces sp. NPDC019443 TaxID=3365061 RepID=UPI00379587CF
MAAISPANLGRRISDQQDAARMSGDRVLWEDAWTSLADCRIYTAAWLGIPWEYVDPSLGHWLVPEDVCWSCWKQIEGLVVVIGVNADCRHHHSSCWPDHDPQVRDGVHGRPACQSRLPHYGGGAVMTRLLTLRGWLIATTALLALTAWGRHEWNRTGDRNA